MLSDKEIKEKLEQALKIYKQACEAERFAKELYYSK